MLKENSLCTVESVRTPIFVNVWKMTISIIHDNFTTEVGILKCLSLGQNDYSQHTHTNRIGSSGWHDCYKFTSWSIAEICTCKWMAIVAHVRTFCTVCSTVHFVFVSCQCLTVTSPVVPVLLLMFTKDFSNEFSVTVLMFMFSLLRVQYDKP